MAHSPFGAACVHASCPYLGAACAARLLPPPPARPPLPPALPAEPPGALEVARTGTWRRAFGKLAPRAQASHVARGVRQPAGGSVEHALRFARPLPGPCRAAGRPLRCGGAPGAGRSAWRRRLALGASSRPSRPWSPFSRSLGPLVALSPRPRRWPPSPLCGMTSGGLARRQLRRVRPCVPASSGLARSPLMRPVRGRALLS